MSSVSIHGMQMTVKSVASVCYISEQMPCTEFIVLELVFKTKVWKIAFCWCLMFLRITSLEW